MLGCCAVNLSYTNGLNMSEHQKTTTKTGRKWIYTSTAAVIVVVAAISFLLTNNGGEIIAPTSSNLIIGVGTHGNVSSEAKALESGVLYFRNDINLSGSEKLHIRSQNLAYGAHYLGILDYATLPGGTSNKNWTLADWNSSVEYAVSAYPEIDAWEIWNEPWVTAFQTGYMNGSAYNYYQVIKSASQIIKSKDRNATVVCFGGAPFSYSWFLWYGQVWAYGASNYCDAISIHAYPSLPFNLTEQQAWSAYVSAYENMTGKPVWVTETGVPASSSQYAGFTPVQQERFLVQDFAFFSNFSYVKRVYWYDLWGLSDGQARNDFGLLNLSDPYYGMPKPAWGAFLELYNRSASAQ